MGTFFLLMAGFAAGALAVYGYYELRREASTDHKPSDHPAPTPLSGDSPSLGDVQNGAAPSTEQLSTQLHDLSRVLESFGELTAHPRDLAEKEEFRKVVSILSDARVALDVVGQYATGANWSLSCAALVALAKREDRDEESYMVLSAFRQFRPWQMYFALEYFKSLNPPPWAGELAGCADQWWRDNLTIREMFRKYFEHLLAQGHSPATGARALPRHNVDVEAIQQFLQALDMPFASTLANVMRAQTTSQVDRSYLQNFGRFWETPGDEQTLVEVAAWSGLLTAAERAITQTAPRSLIVRGDAKTGKSSFLSLLAKRLIAHGWTIFEAGGPDLQAGQSYIGQLEERVRMMVDELHVSKRAIWYVPDILQIATSGTHSGQSASILDQVMPALRSGKLIILSESTPTRLTQLVQLRPNLKGVFEAVPLAALSEEETTDLADSLVALLKKKHKIEPQGALSSTALHLARQYLGSIELPGAVVELIRKSFQRCANGGAKRVTESDLLESLSQTTGLPVSILDNKEKVNLDEMRKFFSGYVMGQDEAVTAVVDRIAMLKAGLTDPTKPTGVFLFAGPTGTGKTELAKALAQYLFGTTERLIRLDMSEMKTADALNKILGDLNMGPVQSDSLTSRVRKQPFSVILLDEFEKAHPNVWDLFLQVFDDGRLSDALGNEVDFRHCIIILTSNLGATVHQNSGVGFGERSDLFSPDQVMMSIKQAFRPEFINRLDRTIIFQPLKRDLMRQILQKELRDVLERRGFRNREWAVEWEASALEFLLDKGFSPELGARPLKRAIDRYLLAQLSATIVEHKTPEGDQFLFVRSDGHSIQVEFVDPDRDSAAEAVEAPTPRTSLSEILLKPFGHAGEVALIKARFADLVERVGSPAWRDLHEKLSLQMAEPAFWNSPTRFDVLARYALMDRVKAAMKTADALLDRLEKSRKKGKYSPDLVGRFARQVFTCDAGTADALENSAIETLVVIEAALEGAGESDELGHWLRHVHQMYKGWAQKRGCSVKEFRSGGASVLAITGFGAHRTMREEAGLHVWEGSEEEGTSSRAIARVRVAGAPSGDWDKGNVQATLDKILKQAISSAVIVRRYRDGASPLVRDAKRGWRSGRLDAVLAGDFDLFEAASSEV